MPQQNPAGHLLVVDDNENNRDMLIRLLNRQGHTFVAAHNGREALDMVRQEEFDLILLDIMMPEIDGFQVLAELKADPVLREIPVIVLSAIQEMDAIIRCVKMGADDYLPKPFDLVLLRARIGATIEKKKLHDREKQRTRELEEAYKAVEQEKRVSESLLLNILPPQIAAELRESGAVEPKHLDNVTILFTDFVGFSSFTQQLSAGDVVAVLHKCFTGFDHIVSRYGLEKLKTIGDSYMMVGGLRGEPSHPVDAVLAAFEMVKLVEQLSIPKGLELKVRVGIHTGSVVAGVVGVHKFAFDVWGDSVNYSSRLEACSEPNRVNLSSRTRELVDGLIECEHRGQIETKDHRLEDMYFANPVLADDFAARYERRYGSLPALAAPEESPAPELA